jgi:hypothetical protein
VKYPPLLLAVNAEEVEVASFVTSEGFCSAYSDNILLWQL